MVVVVFVEVMGWGVVRCRVQVEDGSFFCQAEDGIRGLVRSRGLGDVYKEQAKPAGRIPERLLVRSL